MEIKLVDPDEVHDKDYRSLRDAMIKAQKEGLAVILNLEDGESSEDAQKLVRTIGRRQKMIGLTTVKRGDNQVIVRIPKDNKTLERAYEKASSIGDFRKDKTPK